MALYFAYGSNLNKGQMKYRCPKAKPIGRFVLDDARLVFRGVADVISEPGARCEGGIWKITRECEVALDRYEGFNPNDQGRGMYRKEYIPLLKPIAGETELMIYVMNSTGIMPPSVGYLASIKQGYRDFGLPTKHLMAAVEASHDDKAPSHIERQRLRRNGRPPMAARPSKRKKNTKAEPAKVTTQSDLFRRAMTVYGD